MEAKWRAYGLKVTSLPIEGDELPVRRPRLGSSSPSICLLRHHFFHHYFIFHNTHPKIFWYPDKYKESSFQTLPPTLPPAVTPRLLPTPTPRLKSRDLLLRGAPQTRQSLRGECWGGSKGECWGECWCNTHPFSFPLYIGILRDWGECLADLV